MKTCKSCLNEKDVACFHKDSSKIDGLMNICKQCNKQKSKDYYVRNKEKIHISNKNRYLERKDETSEKSKKYRNDNKELIRQRKALYYKTHKNVVKNYYNANKDKINERVRDRRKIDSNYRLKKNLSRRIRKALKSEFKLRITIEFLGCSINEFKDYLENQFTPEMNWNNYGSYWHVDHIKPCTMFDLTDLEQCKMCFHYTNLQPLEASVNIRKLDLLPNGKLGRYEKINSVGVA